MKKRDPIRECVALTLIKLLGARRIYNLLERVKHPQDVFRLSREELQEVDGVGTVTADAIVTFNRWREVDKILERTQQIGARLLTLTDANYPPLLSKIYDPPVLLWLLGSAEVLKTLGLAVVGTRRPTPYGKKQARMFAAEMAGAGLTVISGLAHGIDTEAHATAVKEKGKTVAVLGSGIDVIYPAVNRGLARSIIHTGGAIISEFPPGTRPEAGNFPVRNRIVSGMTMGALVVESGLEGGSMITASSALDQNREVFVVPHSLCNERGVGCNTLIKRGHGKLVQSMDDIRVELTHFLPISSGEGTSPRHDAKSRDWKDLNLNRTAHRICTLLEGGPVHIDTLSAQMKLSAGELMAELLRLEMINCICQRPGKVFELC